MLKKIVFKNLFSFKEQQIMEFNEEIPVYAIYGKNSAGKTNFLSVLSLLLTTFSEKFDAEDTQDLKNKFNEDNIIEIAAQFEIANIDYFYKIVIDTKVEKIMEQQLVNLKDNQNIITYKEYKLTSSILSEGELNALKNYNISEKGIFKYLDELEDSTTNEELKKIKKYFTYSVNRDDLLKILRDDEEMKKEIIKELNAIDISIDDLKIRENKAVRDFVESSEEIEEEAKKKLLDKISKYKVLTVHNGIEMNIEEESKGTNKYLNLLLKYLIASKVSSSTYIALEDEIETSLHDDVLEKFLKLYSKNIKSQLIFTTHNQKILDDKLLPKENIIFVDKKTNDSEIYKLSDYPELRNDNRHNWKNMYNKNMFGAKPYVD